MVVIATPKHFSDIYTLHVQTDWQHRTHTFTKVVIYANGILVPIKRQRQRTMCRLCASIGIIHSSEHGFSFGLLCSFSRDVSLSLYLHLSVRRFLSHSNLLMNAFAFYLTDFLEVMNEHFGVCKWFENHSQSTIKRCTAALIFFILYFCWFVDGKRQIVRCN